MRVFQLFMYLAIIWIVTFLVVGYVHGLHGMTICFANGELMNKFLEQNPEGAFNITVPCPELPKHIPQEDESGK